MNSSIRRPISWIHISLVIILGFTLSNSVFATTIASSNFDTGSENWGLAGDGTNMSWQSAGGNPGGYINAVDLSQGSMWLFSAPSAYTGNQFAAFAGSLSYSLRVSGNNGWNTSGGDVFLVGNGQRLAAASGPPPTTNWQNYSVVLDSSGGWRFNNLNGAIATDYEIQQVLQNLTSLEIRAEYYAGGDNADLDSVLLDSGAPPVPVPTIGSIGLIMLILALFGFGILGMYNKIKNPHISKLQM